MPETKQSPDGTASSPADTPETIAEIVAQMRRWAKDGVAVVGTGYIADRIEAAYKREHAEWHAETDAAKEERNRIACKMRYEFAAKCRACKAEPGNAAAMRAALNSIADIAKDAFGGPEREREASQGRALSLIIDAARAALAAPPEPPSNAAAMREALVEIMKIVAEAHENGTRTRPDPVDNAVYNAANAALSAPARNCDRFATAVGAMEEWEKYPQSRYKGCRVCPHGDTSMVSPSHLTLAEWLFAPAEGGAE
jgi:hypothetical protein